MSEKYQNKYRISSARWQNWDYGSAGAYFVTICTKNRLHHFGKIVDHKMYLSHTGLLADVFWHEIKNHAPGVTLDEFVVMPNHIHGIVILNGNENENAGDGEQPNVPSNVETRHALSLQQPQYPQPTIGRQRFQNQGKNTLSSIIGSYKSVVTRHANRLHLPHDWQARFHDHVIRNEEEFQKITHYIQNNVSNWDKDKFYNLD